jgi:DNA mismatch repair ATPase MutS
MDQIVSNIAIFKTYLAELRKLTPYSLTLHKTIELGQLMKCFYSLNKSDNFISSLYFSFGFNGYLKNIETIQGFITTKVMNYCSYNNTNPTYFDNSYFANLNTIQTSNTIETTNTTKHKIVKNSYKLDKNIIITGPNASGKTTILKSTLINIIFSQQFGCGFYNSAKLSPFKYIHCYLNIPDTSGRDSLFQAESRRCKEILDIVQEFKKDTHICIFDELFSGTNHSEAVISTTEFMKYLVEFKYVSSLLTTHFIKVCKKLNKNKNIVNFNMHTLKTNTNKNIHTYLLKEGISEVKGGLQVLHDLNFPTEILENI